MTIHSLNDVSVATPSPDELLVGLISLGVVPWIAWTLRRGLASRRLPVGRGYLLHAERPRAFATLIVLYVFAMLGMGWIGLDLLTGGALNATVQ
ncbi:MAG TPA: hypothetical protein VEZ48_00520 [Sphingomonadaceae bacterium]|nr:hypothetical protein [Sphingomonadaceae bacterium]